MKSKAAIGNHPIHPMLVPIPIGCFFLALVGDIAHSRAGDAFWYRLSLVAIAVGIASAILAAVAGAVDYLSVRMSAQGARIATRHALINLTGVGLYAVSLVLRWNDKALQTDRWAPAMALAFAAFTLLAVGGWLGGKLAYEHKVGVVEDADPAATKIGASESFPSRRAS